MIKALLYKEWLKTRWVLAVLAVTAILLHLYIFTKIDRAFGIAGKEHIWDIIVNRKQFLFSDLTYFPLFSAILIALFQFVPEITQKRLKLTLHLPLRENTVVLWTAGYGAGLLGLLYIIQLVFFVSGVNHHFPYEIRNSTLLTITPWYIAGFSAYFLGAAICIEPSWIRRIALILISVGLIKLFYISVLPGSYRFIAIYLPAIAIISVLITALSIFRFKAGIQD
jgi:hypothetical protein